MPASEAHPKGTRTMATYTNSIHNKTGSTPPKIHIYDKSSRFGIHTGGTFRDVFSPSYLDS